MRILKSKFQNNQLVNYNGTYYTIQSKLYCSDLDEWKYYLSNTETKLIEPISEEKLKEV